MSSRSIYEFRSAPMAAATASPRSSFGAVVSICDSPAFVRRSEIQPENNNTDGLGCVRGIRAAFVLEGGMALLAYGIWHFFHLIH